MNRLKMHTSNKADENYRKLAEMFPNAVTETIDENGEVVRAIDKDVLMQEINTRVVDGNEERYQFTWPDKKKSVLLANAPINKTLRPCREESVDFDNTENLYIEGDNLEVLKLLQETYLGKIKMIYIDPPYNTGNDFVYNDEYNVDKEEEEGRNGLFDEDGNQTLSQYERNTASNGRFHTNWLNMIYPRLKVARDLLANDGYICISIDDNEINNMQKLCNEIFGETNFVSDFIIIRSEGGGLAKRAVIGHDYLLVYAKQINIAIPLGKPKDVRGQIITKNGEQYWIETDWFREEFGRYGTCHYEDILIWYNDKKKQEIDNGIKNGQYILIPQNGKHIVGRYRKLAEDTSKFYTVTKHLNKNGVKDLEGIGFSKIFDFPKPISLVKEFVLGTTILSKNNGDIILDFFSGSATTAHAVMQLNAEDGGNRKFIMVQLPELTGEKSEAYKAGYKNICEIGKERIRRAGQKIRNEKLGMRNANDNFSLFSPPSSLDIGFRVLKLDTSNMKDIYYKPDEVEQTLFDNYANNIKEDRTPNDLLFQVMLDLGILLSSKIVETVIDGKKVFNVADGFLIACFDENVTDETITAIAKQKPYYFVMRDSSMASDSVATNFEQIFTIYSPNTIIKML